MLSVVAPITSNYITKGYIAVHYEKNKLETEKNSILNCSYITLAMILALSLIVLITFTFVVYFRSAASYTEQMNMPPAT